MLELNEILLSGNRVDLKCKSKGAFGAVVDCNLSTALSEEQRGLLQQWLNEYRFLLFRNQAISYERQLEVSSWFGSVEHRNRASILSPEPDVGGLGNSALAFHSDLACAKHPLEAISLYAFDVDDKKTSTLFIDATAAATRLPEPLRVKLRQLNVRNLWPKTLSERVRGAEDTPANWPGSIHPVLYRHPRTQEEVLFVNANHTECIEGVSREESEGLIKLLFEYIYNEDFLIEHSWTGGDFLIWDNLALQHARAEIPAGIKRSLRRVEIGSLSYEDQMTPELKKLYKAT